MTRSPFLITLLPLIPLALLAWPLSAVISKKPPRKQTAGIGIQQGPLMTAELSILAAHPFQSVTVEIGDQSWSFAPDEDIQEIQFPRESSVTLTVSATWPDGTPESAILLKLQAEGLPDQSHTTWGWGQITEPVTFTWKDPS